MLYMSNNKIASLNEVDKLAALDKLEDLVLQVGGGRAGKVLARQSVPRAERIRLQ